MKPPAIDSCNSLFHYRPPLDGLVSRFKFRRRLDVGASLGGLMAREFQTRLEMRDPKLKPDIIIPVPLHRKRLNQRGFNQAWELARIVSEVSGVPASSCAVIKVRHTRAQTELSSASSRRRILHTAFETLDSKIPENVKRVTLVDDVVTTAATVNAVARSLKSRGITEVEVCCVARASI